MGVVATLLQPLQWWMDCKCIPLQTCMGYVLLPLCQLLDADMPELLPSSDGQGGIQVCTGIHTTFSWRDPLTKLALANLRTAMNCRHHSNHHWTPSLLPFALQVQCRLLWLWVVRRIAPTCSSDWGDRQEARLPFMAHNWTGRLTQNRLTAPMPPSSLHPWRGQTRLDAFGIRSWHPVLLHKNPADSRFWRFPKQTSRPRTRRQTSLPPRTRVPRDGSLPLLELFGQLRCPNGVSKFMWSRSSRSSSGEQPTIPEWSPTNGQTARGSHDDGRPIQQIMLVLWEALVDLAKPCSQYSYRSTTHKALLHKG